MGIPLPIMSLLLSFPFICDVDMRFIATELGFYFMPWNVIYIAFNVM